MLVITKKSILLFILMFLCCVSMVYAGDNGSTHTYVPNEYYNDMGNVKVVYADSDGHFNIPFSDGSRAYCLEYMEEEAVKGDLFIVANTSFAVNNRTGEDVSNLLKVYFIDYGGYKDTDSVRVQHMIWHFTDDFDGWRINKTLVGDIKETAEYKKLPDSDVIRFNSTHNMGYKFNSFLSPYSHHQNYWGYDVWFELINSCCGDNITNITNVVNNVTNINLTNINNTNIYENNTNITENIVNNYTNITNVNVTENNITNINNTSILNNYTDITENNVNVLNNTTINNIVNNYTNITENNITYVNNTSILNNITENNDYYYVNNTTVINTDNSVNNTTNIYNIENHNYTNISQDTYINNTTNNINNNYINQTENTLNENNTYHNNTLNNYTLIINNQSNIGTPIKYYIIYIIKQNPLYQNIIIQDTPQHQTINPITLHPTGNNIVGIGILIIILFLCALYTIYREHK